MTMAVNMTTILAHVEGKEYKTFLPLPFETHRRQDIIAKFFKGKKKIKILQWLSKIHYTSHYEESLKKLTKDSGYWLLRSRKFVNWAPSNESSAFWLTGAMGTGKTSLVKALCSRTLDDDGQCAMHYAAKFGNLGIIRILLEHNDTQHDLEDVEGRTPLMMAIGSSSRLVAEYLLEKGRIDPNRQFTQGGLKRLGSLNHRSNCCDRTDERSCEECQQPVTALGLALVHCPDLTRVAEMLVLREDFDVRIESSFKGMTPLDYSIGYGLH
ncbi:hypothetical protein QBC35DRAFT_555995 [Podospora australis]|uniref:Ankyrin n=1 Tax=Podospora australis TaxID=1536484 RepID=A0AAN6WQK6_9PEZI|nr:hypothetical protein QBC35DRAFT_555995 [Podospora australis]